MTPYFCDVYGNAASRHAFGAIAAQAVDDSRLACASIIGAKASEIVFTSGATESNNIALKGRIMGTRDAAPHVVVSAIEHPAILDQVEYFRCHGVEVTVVSVPSDGVIEPEAVRRAISPNTAVVSIMFANNELGTIQPITEIGVICEERGVCFHVDAAQAVGRLEVDVKQQRIDLLSFSAHKLYGPKGVGALYVGRKGRSALGTVVHGGGHERGLRSGTLNVPGIVGFGSACQIAKTEMESDARQNTRLAKKLREGILAGIEGAKLNGSPDKRLPGSLNFCIPGVRADAIMMLLPEICMSTGSACSTLKVGVSHVLKEIGMSDEDAHSSIRLCTGRFNTDEDVDLAVERLVFAVKTLRAL